MKNLGYLLFLGFRVHDIMKRDSNKDPATYPNAALAKVLLGQVHFLSLQSLFLNFLLGKNFSFITLLLCVVFYCSVTVLSFETFQVDRKLVKQTVMTSVYGVTFVGAREQIKRRLEEKGVLGDERLLFTAACYAAKVSLCLIYFQEVGFLYGVTWLFLYRQVPQAQSPAETPHQTQS